MAMLDPLSGMGFVSPWLPPEWQPPQGPAVAPFEPDMAQAARDVAAARLRRGARRGGYDPLAMEGPPDASVMGMLNAGAPPDMPAAPVASPSIASPAAAAPAPATAPVPSPSPPPAPAEPSWLGMLNVTNPNAGPADWRAMKPPGIAAPVTATPVAPPAAASPPAPAASPDVPETSLAGRAPGFFDQLKEGVGDAFKGINDWRQNNRLTLMALGAGMAGAQSLGQGLNRGMTMAVPAMQQDIRQTQLNSSYSVIRQRLIDQGHSVQDAEATARAAIGNPAIMQQMVPGLFGAKQRQFTQIGEDMLGNKRFGFVDPVAGKVYDLTGKEVTGQGGGAGTTIPTGADGNPLSGQALLTHLEKTEPEAAAGIKAMIGGDISAQGRNLQKLAPLAALVDPTFDATQYQVRLATRKNYTSGKQFQELQAINTVAGHLDNLSKAADDLNNTRFPWWNTIANTTLQATGDARVDNFNTVKQAVTNELSKAYRGGHVTEGDVREWQSNISAAKSPEQLRGVIGQMNDLLSSKRQALEDGYRSSMGPTPLPSEFKATSDHAAETFNRVADWAHGVKQEKPAPSAQTVTSGKLTPGTSYTWTPQGLVPNQAAPPVPGARQARDGHWYIGEPGNYLRIIH